MLSMLISFGFLVDILLVGEMPTVRTQEKTPQNHSNTYVTPNVCTSSPNQTHLNICIFINMVHIFISLYVNIYM